MVMNFHIQLCQNSFIQFQSDLFPARVMVDPEPVELENIGREAGIHQSITGYVYSHAEEI